MLRFNPIIQFLLGPAGKLLNERARVQLADPRHGVNQRGHYSH